MTELSLAAQAVMNACTDAPIHINWATRSAAAAVLRAAVDQVVPEPQGDPTTWTQCAFLGVREDLLAIAAELDNTSQSS
jgi:hypothetical protein